MHNTEGSKRKKGKPFIIIGIVLIVLALGLTLFNCWEAHKAGASSRHAVDVINDNLPDNLVKGVYGMSGDMKTIEIDGYEYIGKVTIPSQELELPVMAEWDYGKLNISPCRYSGSYFTDDLVIAGHNYITHFAPLLRLSLGADIYFTTVDGIVFQYTVDNIEKLQPAQVEHLVTGDWDLTLFTCNMGGKTRCTVRCIRKDA